MAAFGTARVRAGLWDAGLLAAIAGCAVLAAGFGLSAAHALLRIWAGPAGASALLAVALGLAALALARWRSTRGNTAGPVAPPIPAPVPPTADLGTSAAFLVGFLLARRM